MHIRAVFIVYRIAFICSPLQFRLQFPGVKRHPSFADFASGPSPIRCRKAKEAIADVEKQAADVLGKGKKTAEELMTEAKDKAEGLINDIKSKF